MTNPRPLMVSLDRGNRATSKRASLISQAVSRGGFRSPPRKLPVFLPPTLLEG